MKKRFQIGVIVGTRPEAIKLAPVIQALSKSKICRAVTISTSQHEQMVKQIFKSFGIQADHDLQVMRRSQTLPELASRLTSKLGSFFSKHRMDAVLVQGDTSTAFFGGLSAFYHQIPVGHVEAGLRSGDCYSPFPEEMNRSLLGRVATWHFAPTRDAVHRLSQENVPASAIYLTGNTVVDALRWMAPRSNGNSLKKLLGDLPKGQRLILVTCHRRENLGVPMKNVAKAIAALSKRHPEVVIIFPVHPNPAVRASVMPDLKNLSNVKLCEPMDYDQFLACLQRSYLVLSDSGGVQEEATALGRPVLVLRKETERQEGVNAGALKLVGTDTRKILRESERLLRDSRAYRRMTRASNVFGDGHSAQKIVRILERELLKK
jgi:UDP-N-acetylglucosamine 2-epimerase (non-hydrolysing)